MGENYFAPLQFNLTDDTLYSVYWMGSNYRLVDGCPDRSGNTNQSFVEVSPWGFTVDNGTVSFNSDSHLLVSSFCPTNDNNIATVSLSRSILDSPNFAPFEPFYFILLLSFSIWMLSFAFKTIFGGQWKW